MWVRHLIFVLASVIAWEIILNLFLKYGIRFLMRQQVIQKAEEKVVDSSNMVISISNDIARGNLELQSLEIELDAVQTKLAEKRSEIEFLNPDRPKIVLELNSPTPTVFRFSYLVWNQLFQRINSSTPTTHLSKIWRHPVQIDIFAEKQSAAGERILYSYSKDSGYRFEYVGPSAVASEAQSV